MAEQSRQLVAHLLRFKQPSSGQATNHKQAPVQSNRNKRVTSGAEGPLLGNRR
eukprot:GDKH01025601.1.p7 GENE.GDKH01025601.1~~GDKH01025601.1.p7  ORF type:complete len:53 (+),score=10.27 GDKH01025601.1:403-561(+)